MSERTDALQSSARTGSALPRLAIVGRPNVGKSTLLNRLVNSRISIVEPTAGVTRDRVSVPVRLDGPLGSRWVEAIDTGGIGIVDRDDLSEDVERQVDLALASAQIVLFLVDVRDGPTPLDRVVAERLRRLHVPVLLVVNKVEKRAQAWDVDVFRRLGNFEGPFAISAQEGEGLDPLLARAVELLGEQAGEAGPPPPEFKLAVVGLRNAGKSTLINRLAGEERMIVSEIPGTTRDAVDVRFERDGRGFVAIDTAGLRKKSSMRDAIEFYSDARSYKSIRRADVVVHLFDVSQPLSSIDKRLARYVVDHYKPVILAANKWDLVSDMERAGFVEHVRSELTGLSFAPLQFLSAATGQGVWALVRLAEELLAESSRRVPTGELNRALERTSTARSPSAKGSRVNLFYATQVQGTPPTFVVFVNDKRLVGREYLRFLTKRLREELGFERVPLRVVLKDRSASDADER
jgi:GTP-binding protein